MTECRGETPDDHCNNTECEDDRDRLLSQSRTLDMARCSSEENEHSHSIELCTRSGHPAADIRDVRESIADLFSIEDSVRVAPNGAVDEMY